MASKHETTKYTNALLIYTQKNMQPLCLINTMKISSVYHLLLIYDVNRTTKIYGMGPFENV